MSKLEDLIYQLGEFESSDPQLCGLVYELANSLSDELYSIRKFCELIRDGVGQRLDRVEGHTVDRVVGPGNAKREFPVRGAAADRLREQGINVACLDPAGNHWMIDDSGRRWNFWPSTGRWGRAWKRGTEKTGVGGLINDVLKYRGRK